MNCKVIIFPYTHWAPISTVWRFATLEQSKYSQWICVVEIAILKKNHGLVFVFSILRSPRANQPSWKVIGSSGSNTVSVGYTLGSLSMVWHTKHFILEHGEDDWEDERKEGSSRPYSLWNSWYKDLYLLALNPQDQFLSIKGIYLPEVDYVQGIRD